LEQSYQNFEIVIINDGSTDDTDSVCRAIAKHDPRIFYTSQANQGAHNTINRGICISSGDYVCILNSDDRFYPDKLERCVDVMATSPDTDLISGKIVFVDEGDRPLESGIEIDWLKRAFSFFDRSQLLALSVLNSLMSDTGTHPIINIENGDYCPYLEGNDIIEVSSIRSERGFSPLGECPHLPAEYSDLLQQVKQYERLTVDAAESREFNTVVKALKTHPIIPVDRAEALAEALLAAAWMR